MVGATYNVRTLAVKGRNGFRHADCVLAKPRQLGCASLACIKQLELGKQSSLLQDTEFSALGKKRIAGKDCIELVW